MSQSPILVCFAVKEEAAFFQPRAGNCEQLITGMGRMNAMASVRAALAATRPRMVITAGFAGGLRPELQVGAVVFDMDAELETSLGASLLKHGASPARFHWAESVAVTAAEKGTLLQSTRADAVEMESAAIRALCAEQKIPSATIRVISDEATEDLPLDFNRFMTRNYRINHLKLAWTIALHPGKIPQLKRFQKQTILAARRLGEALQNSL